MKGRRRSMSACRKYWPYIGSAGLAWLVKDENWEGRIGAPYPPMIDKGKSLSAIDYIEALDAFRQIYRQPPQISSAMISS